MNILLFVGYKLLMRERESLFKRLIIYVVLCFSLFMLILIFYIAHKPMLELIFYQIDIVKRTFSSMIFGSNKFELYLYVTVYQRHLS